MVLPIELKKLFHQPYQQQADRVLILVIYKKEKAFPEKGFFKI